MGGLSTATGYATQLTTVGTKVTSGRQHHVKEDAQQPNDSYISPILSFAW
jgi:hypothetical protein